MGGGGAQNVSKMTPPLILVENHEAFGFFGFEPKRYVSVLALWGLYGADGDES